MAEKPVTALAVLGLVIASVLAYANSLSVPLLFDDLETVQNNPHIRQLWPLGQALTAAPRSVLTGRPLVSLTLAINYAFGGTNVRGYHAFNLALHVLSGLVLFDIVRRSLRSLRLCARFGRAAPGLAAAVTGIWLVHPLQTDAVTYITQRTELLMGFFYLLTLDCALRAWDGRAAWAVGSVLCCSLGMLSKEVMVSAPLVVALHDWTTRAERWPDILARRWTLYAGLAATWAILGVSLYVAPRDAAIGFDQGLSAWAYLRTQVVVLVRYLGLALWPRSLCLDRGMSLAMTAREIVSSAAVVGGLGLGTLWALWRRAPIGFLGAWFFLVLAPTSSVVPITLEPMAERRIYLSLAAVVSAIVMGTYAAATASRREPPSRRLRLGGSAVLVTGVVALALVTRARNADYATALSIWSDTVHKAPANPRAHLNLGMTLAAEGRHEDSMAEFVEAVRLKPDLADALNNLGVGLVRLGKLEEGTARIREAIRARPDYPPAHYNLAAALKSAGRINEAIAEYEECLRIKPDFVGAHINLGALLSDRGRPDEAIAHYREALRIQPDVPEAHYNLGNALSDIGDLQTAIDEYAAALRLRPEFPQARNNLDSARALLAQRTTP